MILIPGEKPAVALGKPRASGDDPRYWGPMFDVG